MSFPAYLPETLKITQTVTFSVYYEHLIGGCQQVPISFNKFYNWPIRETIKCETISLLATIKSEVSRPHLSVSVRASIADLKMKVLVALSVLAFMAIAGIEAGVSMNNPFYCYSTDRIRSSNQMHSVRTSYEAIRRTEINPAVSCEF